MEKGAGVGRDWRSSVSSNRSVVSMHLLLGCAWSVPAATMQRGLQDSAAPLTGELLPCVVGHGMLCKLSWTHAYWWLRRLQLDYWAALRQWCAQSGLLTSSVWCHFMLG